MWLLSASFDGETTGDLSFQKTKLLKTGSSYPLGRKERPLLVNNKKVSHDHCEFIVGGFSQEDAANPSVQPTLEFVNKKTKVMKLVRGGEEMGINPSTTLELEDGDIIAIVTDIPITVQWMPLCCYSQATRGKLSVSLAACAALGIHLVPSPNPSVTHHLTPSFSANPAIAASLLSACHFVKPEWLNEVIRLGSLPMNNDPSNGISLEQTFTLPLLTKYRPTFSPALPSHLKAFKVWEPNEERLNMFKGYRFLFVGEKGREVDGETKEVVSRGGAEYEVFNVSAGKTKWHQALTKGIRRVKDGAKGFVVVADESGARAAIGKDGWKDLYDALQSCGLRFIAYESIIQAVMDVDTSLVNSSSGMDVDETSPRFSSPLPDFVPNTHPEEPSLAPSGLELPEAVPGPSRRLTRRAASGSRQASQEPLNVPKNHEEENEAPRPRKALTRRAKAGLPLIVGIDDPSSVIDAVPDLSSTDVMAPPLRLSNVVDLTISTPARSSRLKRRVGTSVQTPLESQALSIAHNVGDVDPEPPLKKFKALFEASDPHHIDGGSYGDNVRNDGQSDAFAEIQSLSQTQTQTQARGSRPPRSGVTGLAVVREEEESQSGMGSMDDSRDRRGTKRKTRGTEDGEDTEMAGVEEALNASSGPGSGSGPLLTAGKKRAVEGVNAVERSDGTGKDPFGSKPPSSKAKSGQLGAAPGKPDTDTAFLKAIASTKRGKKTEDSFDREFNKLKISKPDLGREEQEKEWAVLEDFGDDMNVRGNFMVVVDMEVFRKDGARRQPTSGEVRLEWRDRPNFKKFKKRDVAAARNKVVDLVISEENDYGMGAAYWKSGTSQVQSQEDSQGAAPSQKQTLTRPIAETQTQASRKGKSRAFVVDDSDDDVIEQVATRKGKPKAGSRAASAVPQKRASTRTTKTSEKNQPLFLDSDDDIKTKEDDDQDFDALGGNDQDDADDAETLQSSGGNTNQETATRRTRMPAKSKKVPAPIIVDDDSDDGAVFKGFKGRKRGR